MNKTTSKIQEVSLGFLEKSSKVIAYVVCLGLLIASAVIVVNSFDALFNQDLKLAVQDGLFVLILLEMFYVTRSFVRRGSINVSIVINVGIIAAVKEMIFRLESMTLHNAIAFGVIFATLSFTYFMEKVYFDKLVKGR